MIKKIIISIVSFFLNRLSLVDVWKMVFKKMDDYIPQGKQIPLTSEIISSSERFLNYLRQKEYYLIKSLYGKSPEEQNLIIGRVAEIREIIYQISNNSINNDKSDIVSKIKNELEYEILAVDELNKLKLTNKNNNAI